MKINKFTRQTSRSEKQFQSCVLKQVATQEDCADLLEVPSRMQIVTIAQRLKFDCESLPIFSGNKGVGGSARLNIFSQFHSLSLHPIPTLCPFIFENKAKNDVICWVDGAGGVATFFHLPPCHLSILFSSPNQPTSSFSVILPICLFLTDNCPTQRLTTRLAGQDQ